MGRRRGLPQDGRRQDAVLLACWESREVSGAKPTMKKWSAREGDEIDGLLAEVGVEPPGKKYQQQKKKSRQKKGTNLMIR